jgi:hypothetical protein
MSVRNILVGHNLIAVSANLQEEAINTEQDLDTSMLVEIGNVINLTPRRESNIDEARGKEEADDIYDLGAISEGSLNFNKAMPQHFAFILAYALGQCSSAAAGATGYKHTITPMELDLFQAQSNPGFTLAMRLGDQVLKRRFASMFVDSFTATFESDAWVKLSAAIKGTGKYTDNVTEETLEELDDAESITLAANGVQGASAATRLANVQRIIAEYPSTGVWTDVEYSAVSDAAPAVITITSLGGAGATVDYKVMYVPTEPAWCTFPARIVETPMRVVQLVINVGGKWTGTAISGGHEVGSALKGFTWTFKNGITPELSLGSGLSSYANRALRTGREQSISMSRDFYDMIYQLHIADNDDFVVHCIAEGAEYEDGHNYTVEVVFPKCRVLSAPLGVDGKRLNEKPAITILEDDTYGSVIAYVKNKVETYAATA